MRIQYLLIIFLLIFLGISLPIFLDTDFMTKAAHQNDEYSQYLITATEGSLAAVTDNNTNQYIFSTAENREKAVETFYEVLIKCFNYEYSTYEELVKDYVPCIFLIDTDGYYIEYTTEYTDSEGVYCYEELITPINKWAKTYSIGGGSRTGIYTVEYHLDDTVIVTYKNRRDEVVTYSGYYTDIYAKYGHPQELSSFANYDSFNAEKTDVIINILQDKLEYYINTYDGFLNQQNNTQYEFTLPQLSGDNWARLIDNPTVISFLQGKNERVINNNYNVFAFAGAEVEEDSIYYIRKDETGMKYYHRDFCIKLYNYDMQQGYSMVEAAKQGAYPCPECIK